MAIVFVFKGSEKNFEIKHRKYIHIDKLVIRKGRQMRENRHLLCE